MNSPIYCINLACAQDRRARMVQRLRHLGVLDTTTFIDAYDKNSATVATALEGFTGYPITEQVRAEAGCYHSHLLALKQFLSSPGEERAIICEDDVMFHNNFTSEFARIMSNCPPDIPLLSLGYIVLHWQTFPWAGLQPELHNLRALVPELTWGCQCYLISRDYAMRIVAELDRPFRELSGYITSELILKRSGGCLSWPPLAIEEVIDSYNRPQSEMDIHFAAFDLWGYFNYADAETQHRSDLYKEHVRRLVQIQRKHMTAKQDKPKLLWISRLGYGCSYSYVSMNLLKGLVKEAKFDLYIFCNGIAHTNEKRQQIADELGLPVDKLYIIDQKLQASNNAEDHEYFNNFFSGIYHLSDVMTAVRPDLVISLDDNVCITRQLSVLSTRKWDFKYTFIPYMTVDCDNLLTNINVPKVKRLFTMTEFGQKQFAKFCPHMNVSVVPHIVDHNTFHQLPAAERAALRIKWLKLDDAAKKFVIGAINANNIRKRWDIVLHSFAHFACKHPDAMLLMKVPYITPKQLFGLSQCPEYDFAKLVPEICHQYKLANDRIVILEGEFSDQELNEIYNCCDIGLSTTSGEGWGLIPCEMALCKIPQLVPNFSSFPEIFPASAGLIPAVMQPFHFGRDADAAQSTAHSFIPIIKSYTYHEKKSSVQKQVALTENIATICISSHGSDTRDSKNCYSFSAKIDVVAHFRTVDYAINFLKDYVAPARLQILLGLEQKFLTNNAWQLQDLNDALPVDNRHNICIDYRELRKYWDLDFGAVAVPEVSTVVAKLEQFYSSIALREQEGEYCYQRIRTMCDKDVVIEKLVTLLTQAVGPGFAP